MKNCVCVCVGETINFGYVLDIMPFFFLCRVKEEKKLSLVSIIVGLR